MVAYIVGGAVIQAYQGNFNRADALEIAITSICVGVVIPRRTGPTARASTPASTPASAPYQNGNPIATEGEVAAGRLLNGQAQEGAIPGVARVRGLPEVKGQPSPDYEFIGPNGNRSTGDLLQPTARTPDAILPKIILKGRQGGTVVVELGPEQNGISLQQARQLAENAVSQPPGAIDRVIIIRNGAVIVVRSRGQ